MRKLIGKIGRCLGHTPLGRFPVRVRRGLAQGAWWTAFPHSAYWRGTYETDVDQAVQRLGDLRGAACWDLGTHYGIYTVGLALAVGPEGQIAAFEPDPKSYARCHRHVLMNRLHWVRLYQAAVSEGDGQADIMHYSGLGTPTTHLRYPGEEGVGATHVPVTTVSLDSLVKKGEIRLPRLVKIDVEGHGAESLRGAVESIREARPWIVMGFHSPHEYLGVRDLLAPLGYGLFDCLTDRQYSQPTDWLTDYLESGTDTLLLRCC
ncbi:MAG TPA: FkbM family methyltransferase [Gemmata sp.]|nr:FkbM family methyltransferase [Gemmata sp.]